MSEMTTHPQMSWTLVVFVLWCPKLHLWLTIWTLKVQISSVDFQTSPSRLCNFSEHQKASEDVLRTSRDIFWDVSWQFGPQRMCWYEDKGARPEGSGCSVWTSAVVHGSRTQAKLGINMDVHQAPCPLPPCLSLCAAMIRCVPVNSINSMAESSSHAKVINKHPQMAHNDSLQSDAAVWRVSRRVVAAHSSVCITVYRHSATLPSEGRQEIRVFKYKSLSG